MTIPTVSSLPRMVPASAMRLRNVGTRSTLQPRADVSPAFNVAERVPSVFDTPGRAASSTDIFGAAVPGQPSPDKPHRIGVAGFGDTSQNLIDSASAALAQVTNITDAQAYATKMGQDIQRIKDAQTSMRNSLTAGRSPVVATTPTNASINSGLVVSSDAALKMTNQANPDLVRAAPPVAAPSAQPNTGVLIAAAVGVAAIGGVVAWKMGLFGKKAG